MSIKKKYPLPRTYVRKVVVITIFIGLTVMSNHIHFNKTIIPISAAASQIGLWNITLHITESSGVGNTVIFGKAADASDGLDLYDLPEPPISPQLPFIRSWFDTSFAEPFNNLLQEYKSFSSDRAVWNLSIVWVPVPGNQSTTKVSILWDPAQVNASYNHSFLLYENITVVADMVMNGSYSFMTNGTLHRFQIIYQNEISNNTGKPMEIPIFPLIIGGFVCIVIIVAAFIFIKRKMK